MNNPFADIFNSAAGQYGLDPAWTSALGQWESGFNPNAQSSAGAIGVMQLMPRTGASVGVTDFTDPTQNIFGGTAYLAQLLQKAGGDYPTAVMWYNCGPGNTCPAGQKEAAGVTAIAQQNGATSTSAGSSFNPNNCSWTDIACWLNSAYSIGQNTKSTAVNAAGNLAQWVTRIPIIILGLILLAGAVYLYKE